MSLKWAFRAAHDNRSAFRVSDGSGDSQPVGIDWGPVSGHFVLWRLENSASAVRTLIAAVAIGVVPILLPQRLPIEKIDTLRRQLRPFDFFDGANLHQSQDPVQAGERPFLGLMTSGSTAEPRLLLADEAALTAGVNAIHAAQRLLGAASTGVMLPLAYSFAFVNQLLWAILHERRLTILPGFRNPSDTSAQLAGGGSDMICLVGDQVRILESLRFDDVPIPQVQVVNCAGGPFPSQSYPFLSRMFPAAAIFNNYGCAEAMPRLTVCEINNGDIDPSFVGRPIQGVRLRIAGSDAVGPITFNAPSASYGTLLGDGSVRLHGEWIESGDLGRLDATGLYVLGRHDQVVKLGGERISLLELEQSLITSAVSHAFVWSDTSDGSCCVHAVISSPTPPQPHDLTQALRKKLPRQLWPRAIFWSDTWPLLPNGKPDRLELKRLALDGALPLLFQAKVL